jgi:hypothetical protein
VPDAKPTSPPIFTYIDARIPMRCYEHVAALQRSNGAAARGAGFLGEGLHQGQRCCYLAPAALHPGMRSRLRELGLEVDRQVKKQALLFPPPVMEADDLLDWMKAFFAAAEAAHVPAVRWLEDGIWTPPARIPVPLFFEFHSHLNYLVKQYPSVALCQYDTDLLDLPHLFSAIAVHRHLLVQGTLVRDNPFYIPAEKFLTLSTEEREHDLRGAFREVGFDLERLFSTLAGYGRLQQPESPGP